MTRKKILIKDERGKLIREALQKWENLSKDKKKAYSQKCVNDFVGLRFDVLSKMTETERKNYIHNNCRPRDEFIRETVGIEISDGTIHRCLRKRPNKRNSFPTFNNGFVYVVISEAKPGIIKVGYAKDICQRLKSLNFMTCSETELYKVAKLYFCEKQSKDLDVIRKLEEMFPGTRVEFMYDGKIQKKEFFRLQPEAAEFAIKSLPGLVNAEDYYGRIFGENYTDFVRITNTRAKDDTYRQISKYQYKRA